jgi:hypothetical protein
MNCCASCQRSGGPDPTAVLAAILMATLMRPRVLRAPPPCRKIFCFSGDKAFAAGMARIAANRNKDGLV